MNKIRILIADDHSLMRVGLRALFSHQTDMMVIGEACDGLSAVKLAGELDPDIIIMDLMMPKLDGADATRCILNVAPDTKIIILTSYSTSDDLVRAISNGVNGALIKSAPIEEIVEAVHTHGTSEGNTAFGDTWTHHRGHCQATWHLRQLRPEALHFHLSETRCCKPFRSYHCRLAKTIIEGLNSLSSHRHSA